MKKNETTLGAAMDRLIKKLSLQEEVLSDRVQRIWNEEMSALILSRTEKVFLRKDVLFIHVLSSSLKHELFLSREKIKENMNNALGEKLIRQVIIK